MKAFSIKRNRLLRLTGDYQKKHPELMAGLPVSGRVALAKRAEYMKKASRIFISDRYLLQMLISSKFKSYQGEQKIAQFILKRSSGNKRKACKYVESLISGLGESVFTDEEIKRLAISQGISEEKIESSNLTSPVSTDF